MRKWLVSERCPVTATASAKNSLTSPSIHQCCGWLPRYKQLPLQLDLMTLRGRRICSLGSSYVLFINLLNRHLKLLNQSCRAPDWAACFGSQWFAPLFLYHTVTYFCSWCSLDIKKNKEAWKHCHRFYLQHHSDPNSSGRWESGLPTAHCKPYSKFTAFEFSCSRLIILLLRICSVLVPSIFVQHGCTWQLQHDYPHTDWYLHWHSLSGIMKMNDGKVQSVSQTLSMLH